MKEKLKHEKRILSLLLSVIMLVTMLPFATFSASAATIATEGYLTYMVEDGKATITDCDTAVSGDFEIPSTLGGYPVTNIRYFAFDSCTNLISIRLPDSVTAIGAYAFKGCVGLTSITVDQKNNAFSSIDGVIYNKIKTELICYPTGKNGAFLIPNSVTTIGFSAFDGCAGLTTVTIPDSVTYIDPYAFKDCSKFISITIPDSVTTIDFGAFEGCMGLIDVWYGGTKVSRAGITIGNYNDPLNNATWHYMFGDLPTSHWAYDSIFYCYRNGIMNGTGDGTTFNPTGTMTRAALVQTFYNLQGTPEVNGSAGFSDVSDDAWYADAVTWASQNGIVNGKGNGTFAPTEAVTRASFATVLYNYAEYLGMDVSARAELSGFADSAIVPVWAAPYFQWAVAEGLLNGTPKDGAVYVDPTGKATRAQGAMLLQKFCEM